MSFDSVALEEFRREVSLFLDEEITPIIKEAGRKITSMFSPFDEALAFQKLLHKKKGWAGVSWPLEYGGTGWGVEQQVIFHEACRERELPFLLPNALQMVGPAIMRFGSDQQKQRFLPEILRGDAYWTQGYSEPGAGSDLVSLQCRAVRDGDDYIINGSKIWTTLAHRSNRMFMLVKTDVECKPQRGITFLLLDRTDFPGMEVRPIIGLDGCPEQCEVFFDNVRVPVSSRLGEENEGWSVAKYLLEHERGGSAGTGTLILKALEHIKSMAATLGDGFGGSLYDDGAFQARLAALYLEAKSVSAVEEKMFSLDMGGAESGPFSSLVKVVWTECLQRVCTFSVDVCGSLVLPLQLEALEVGSDVEAIGDPAMLIVMPRYLNNQACSIYGGSNEIQRQIIAKAVLSGLTLSRSKNPIGHAASPFSEDQMQLLNDSMDRFFADNYDFDFRQKTVKSELGYSQDHWRQYAEFGWLGIPFDESLDGFGGSLLDTLYLANTFGDVLALEPYLSAVVLAGGVIASGSNELIKSRVIPEIISGEAIAALAYEEKLSRGNPCYLGTTASEVADGFHLRGEKVTVLNAQQARYLVVSARTAGAIDDRNGVSLFLVDLHETPLPIVAYSMVDGHRAANIVFDVVVAKENVIAGGREGFSLLNKALNDGILYSAAESLSAIKTLLTDTVSYTTERKQFGMPLASFQTLNHKMADMFISYQQLDSLYEQTVNMYTQTGSVSSEQISLLKAQLGVSGRFVGEAAIHLHGGMGMTDELRVGHYFKRLVVNNAVFGNTDFHYKRLWREVDAVA
ncbi:Acyl-CoA dehydrogenase FadE26 [Zhongshania aliphaticivorans]|uniref:Acyl-CoA dehydrogenase FadE26 n=1 Tax=Zhongshania aliphaticivorans TaxID=1470434 RepID=A0A5S9MX60_9GAMM|nr:acyl-CoA dehydrogenase family protein [Zhongshania aliphaticivorans]CAA0081740.1 Acyl-CoA dehydrogenase FadE26 [Zhongshania aliphaticivorans]CAA0084684.1 Acyl-CoA dehydrogenase FadE26 [Zhongshania aliphaticivorans]